MNLNQINFGQRVAEDEAKNLHRYFVTTEEWRRLFEGEVDIIYGAKGVGKSALYAILDSKRDALFDKNILLTTAENPRGNTVFEGLVVEPPTSEQEFIKIWKLYFLLITVEVFKEWDLNNNSFKELTRLLEAANLIPPTNNLRALLRTCRLYISQLRNLESLEPSIDYNDIASTTSAKFKISFREPSPDAYRKGVRSINNLYELLEKALINSGYSLWIAVDRLDVAFEENQELEKNALKALFKVYRDLIQYEQIKIKIFLRDDIWKRILNEGFRESSHITKTLTISWTKESILNLIIRRLLNNKFFVSVYALNTQDILNNYSQQREIFYRFFPEQIDVGTKKSKTLDWIVTRVKDGNGLFAPREVIHLLNEAVQKQLKYQEIGQNDLEGSWLVGRRAFKDALNAVSKVRLEQTLFAEYPSYKDYIQKLEGEKAEQRISTLSRLWNEDEENTIRIAKELSEMVFFEEKGNKDEPRFWIPFLYRNELKLIQGTAD